MVASAAPQLKEELTKAVTNTPNSVAIPTNQPIIIDSPNVGPNINTTNSPSAQLSNINQPQPTVKEKENKQKFVAKKEKKARLYKRYTGLSLTLEDGESYFSNILKSVRQFSSRESLSHLSAASTIPFDANVLDAAVVCFQKVSKGYFRVHSVNPKANGLVTDPYDKSLLHRIFQLNKTDKFSFFIRTGPAEAEEILVFNGLVFSKTGKGNERGDSVCFARYNVEKIKPKS